MELTIERLQKIVEGLPIHYYLGRKLNVEVKNEDKTYFNLREEKISIGLQTINTALSTIEDNIDDTTLESYIRTLVYHEVSHALLTPKVLSITDIINIFEDERIETLCKNYYYNVNFKKFVKLINHYNPAKPIKSAKEFFYRIVRFRNGPTEFVEKVEHIIDAYKFLNFNSKYYDTDDYYRTIMAFYRDVERYYEEHSKEEEKEESKETTSKEKEKEESKDNEEKEESKDNDEEKEESKETTSNDEDNDEENDEDTSSKEYNEVIIKTATKVLDNLIENSYCKSVEKAFQEVIERKKKVDKRNGSAMNAYSGQFDVRSVIRNDYKWFVQSNRLGNVKHFSKVKLNLFIDTSGSFYENDNLVNAILHSLEKLEKQNKDFEFDVVTMAIKQTLLPKDKRRICSRGGNCLDASIFDLYKKVQDRHSSNINIVLFDGDALSDKWYNPTASYKNFKAFDNNNTILITDYSNKKYIEKASISKCKIVITSEYLKNLESNIIKSLSKIA